VLVHAFGKRAANPSLYLEKHSTQQPWQLGGPVTYMPPGVLSVNGAALRKSIGRIHLAGTETAGRWTG
jgi:monoamine oxidase